MRQQAGEGVKSDMVVDVSLVPRTALEGVCQDCLKG